VLYLRRLPELDARDRAVLRAVLRAFFERDGEADHASPTNALQLALPGTTR
jgi:hypothetical protein